MKYQSKSENFEPEEVVFLYEEPFHDASSDKIHFPKRDPKPRKDYTPKNVYIPPENPLEGLTDGRRKNFTLKHQSKKENFKKEEVVFRTEVPLDDTTSYKTYLLKRDATPRKDYSPKEIYLPTDEPLDELIDHKGKFKGRYLPMIESMKKNEIAYKSQMMDLSRVSQLHYVKPNLKQKLPVMNPSEVILRRQKPL